MILLLEDRYDSPFSIDTKKILIEKISSKINHGALGVGSKTTVSAYTPKNVMTF